MAYSWIDVKPGDWFYNEVMEASNLILEDGQPFIAGIPYNYFKAGKPYVYKEFTAGAGQKIFILPMVVEPTGDNPLFVYIDGVQTMYSEVTNDGTNTNVELYAPPRSGALVSVISYGVPEVDENFKKPSGFLSNYKYPQYMLSKAGSYVYSPQRMYAEYVYAFGQALRRAQVDEGDWSALTDQQLCEKYIGYKTDTYVISPTGIVFMPYNYNDVTCKIVYAYKEGEWTTKKKTEDFKPHADVVLFNNRFFPNALINRAEAYVLIARLRDTFYSKFTDQEPPSNILNQTIISYNGQRVFRLNGYYTAGTGDIKVRVDGILQDLGSDYQEFDDHTVLFNIPLPEGKEVNFYFEKTESDVLVDVGRESYMYKTTDSSLQTIPANDWWQNTILSMEAETYGDNGARLISGVPVSHFYNLGGGQMAYMVGSKNELQDWGGTTIDPPRMYFMPRSPITRGQTVAFLNRFRKWALERFK